MPARSEIDRLCPFREIAVSDLPALRPEAPPLPIDAELAGLCRVLRQGPCVVLQAPPGAGKTTRVPWALAREPAIVGEIWVTQPRRMAAVLSARRVAWEVAEQVGQSVGYAVRFEEVGGPQTRIRFVTDGVFLRRLSTDPQLRGIGAVVLDEFHERRLASDMALGLVRQLQRAGRPDLRLVVMSATLDAEPVAAFLGDAPVWTAPGLSWPVDISFAATLDHRPLEDQVAAAVRQLTAEGPRGDILVFLPGAAEIRRAAQRLAPLASQRDLLVQPLHGSLPLAEQERALAPSAQTKIVLATNLCETSVTLPGVVAVVDSGLARTASHAAWSGLPLLQLGRISRASATQRAGRAGRVQAGKCLRLYTEHEHEGRPSFDKPEVQRADLSDPLLQLTALGVPWTVHKDAASTFWLSAPPPDAVDLAMSLLQQLGALDSSCAVTRLGHRLLRYPTHPRLSRLLASAVDAGAVEAGCLAAALLGEQDARGRGVTDPGHIAQGDSDVLALCEAFDRADATPFRRQVEQARRQLHALVRRDPDAARPPPTALSARHQADAVSRAVLAAFPDRVARRRAPGSRELSLASGAGMRLDERSEATEPEFLVVVDAEERRDGRTTTILARQASGIEASWLLDQFSDRVTLDSTLVWSGQRVVATEDMRYGNLRLDASTRPAPPSEAASAVLRDAVLALPLSTFVDEESLQTLQSRVAFARGLPGLGGLAALEEEATRSALAALCEGKTALADVIGADLLGSLRGRVAASLEGKGRARLDEVAPEFLVLPGGRRLAIHYERDRAPWVASRLQDFFGMRKGPRVGQGDLPLVLHLLAPNQRPVQVTTDLEGFWDRHYPALRKELGRRYPRHAWPEDPRTATPPPAGRPR